MTATAERALGSRGAILIQVAISLFALTAFSAFVLDYGVMWMCRRQAQNAADAGALAGAIARAYDETADPPSAGGPAYQSAFKAAVANNVWQTPPAAVVSWECPSFVTGSGCVRVDVYQDGTNGSTTLPTYFANLVSVNSQGVRATATAQAGVANASNCLKPWAIPDKWQEAQTPPWDPTDTFDRYYMSGSNKGTVLPVADGYTAPSASGPGTGYTLAADFGTPATLKQGSGGSSIAPGDWQIIDLPDGSGGYATGGSAYSAAIAGCNGNPVKIGDFLPVETGAKVGPTRTGVSALIALDPNATWNASTKTINNSCAPGVCADGLYHNLSPRIAAVATYNPDVFQQDTANSTWPNCPGGGSCVQITNILGFFITSLGSASDVNGVFVNYPGLIAAGGGTVGSQSGFAKVITLVR